MKRKSIAIDMDGVIADTATQFRTWYERETGIQIPASAFEGIPEDDCLPDGAVRRYLYQPGFFRTMPVMPGAQQAVQRLMETFDIYIVSAAMEFQQSLPEKCGWLSEHFPFLSWQQLVFCGDKSIINTDYMIDDHVKNLDRFAGRAFLFTAGHNRDIRHHRRLANWDEALEVMTAEVASPDRSNSL